MQEIRKYFIKIITLFLIGGLIYIGLEIVWRGRTHFTMFFLGGLDFVLIGALNEHLLRDMQLLYQSFIGACIITGSEFITGYIVNIRLHWNVWNYSHLPFNIMGQICLPFSLIWIVISLLVILLDDHIRHWLFKEKKTAL